MKCGASELAVHDIEFARRDSLLARLEQQFSGKLCIGGTDPWRFALSAHATPHGMKKAIPCRKDTSCPGADHSVANMGACPAVSPLITAARVTGCWAMPGSGMLEAQAFLLTELLMKARHGAG